MVASSLCFKFFGYVPDPSALQRCRRYVPVRQVASLIHTYVSDVSSNTAAATVATVRGVDLYPPPVSWVPPNCILEVDDILEDWTYRQPFDLIHMRLLLGAFTPEEWDRVYRQCYE